MAGNNCSQKRMDKLEEIRISVRGLVEFLLKEGDIDNRRHTGSDDAMQEGSRIHRMIQKRMGAEYKAEVSMRYTKQLGEYTLVVEGRADGVITRPDGVIIDEIKGTYRDVARMKSPKMVHLAQARCYAYFYGLKEGLSSIGVRMTYCNIETEDTRYFTEECDMKQLREWFEGLIGEYRKWSDYQWQWRQIRQRSIEQLSFPFPIGKDKRSLPPMYIRLFIMVKSFFWKRLQEWARPLQPFSRQ